MNLIKKIVSGLLMTSCLFGCTSGGDPPKCNKNPANDTGEFCCLISATFPANSVYNSFTNRYFLVTPLDGKSYISYLDTFFSARGGTLSAVGCTPTSAYASTPTLNPCFWSRTKIGGQAFAAEVKASQRMLVEAFTPPCKTCDPSPACNICATEAANSSACASQSAACNADAQCASCISCLDSGSDISLCSCSNTVAQALGLCLFNQCPECAGGVPVDNTQNGVDNPSICWADPVTDSSSGNGSLTSSSGSSSCQMSGADCASNTDCCSSFCIGADGTLMGTCN